MNETVTEEAWVGPLEAALAKPDEEMEKDCAKGAAAHEEMLKNRDRALEIEKLQAELLETSDALNTLARKTTATAIKQGRLANKLQPLMDGTWKKWLKAKNIVYSTLHRSQQLADYVDSLSSTVEPDDETVQALKDILEMGYTDALIMAGVNLGRKEPEKVEEPKNGEEVKKEVEDDEEEVKDDNDEDGSEEHEEKDESKPPVQQRNIKVRSPRYGGKPASDVAWDFIATKLRNNLNMVNPEALHGLPAQCCFFK